MKPYEIHFKDMWHHNNLKKIIAVHSQLTGSKSKMRLRISGSHCRWKWTDINVSLVNSGVISLFTSTHTSFSNYKFWDLPGSFQQIWIIQNRVSLELTRCIIAPNYLQLQYWSWLNVCFLNYLQSTTGNSHNSDKKTEPSLDRNKWLPE